MSSVLIIGGGAAGMMAAIAAGYNGNEVHLFEKNDRLGKKIFITGKGRCNLTNASSIENHFSNIIYNEKFLYSAYNNFSSEDICNMIESTGIETKIERGNRVFPLSDKSSDVIWALDKMMKDIGVNVHLKSEITKIENSNNKVILIDKHNNKFAGDKCIVATGGMSYETTGSTGDGYKFAEEMGHTVSKTYHPDADGSIRMEITEDDALFSGDFTVFAYACDQVGNETEISEGTTEFGLEADIIRIREPQDAAFRCGESGILTFTVWGYADRVEVIFPKEMTDLCPELNRIFDYRDKPGYRIAEQLQFMVPLYTPENENFEVTVKAYKGDKKLEDHPGISVIGVKGSVLEDLRTRLR